MPNKKRSKPIKKQPSKKGSALSPLLKKLLLTLLILLAVATTGKIAFDIWYDNYIGGPEYRAAKERCGREPVAGFAAPLTKKLYYVLPESRAYDDYAPGLGNIYFCSEQEALSAGHKEFPLSVNLP
jgi:hypothetical protein